MTIFSWRKASVVALTVAAAMSGTVGTAGASLPSVKIQVCNKLPYPAVFVITGINQNGQRVSVSSNNEVKKCFTPRDHWWAVKQNVAVAFRNPRNPDPGAGGVFNPWVPSGAEDGSTLRFDAEY